MNTSLLITLGVLIFMGVSFMTRKISFGLTGMICVSVLALTKVVDLATAFSGFSNKTTILVATMMLVAGCIGKTSIVSVLRKRMSVIQQKNGILLLIAIFVFTLILTQLMGMTALMSVMLLLITTLDDKGELCQSRMFFLVAAINAAWFGKIPVGMSAALPLTQNAYYEGLVTGNPEALLGVFDYFKVGVIPAIVLSVYCLFAWKFIPKTQLDTGAMQLVGTDDKGTSLTLVQEKTVWAVFAVVMVSFFFSRQLGDILYVIPIIGSIIMVLIGVLSTREAAGIVANDMVFCVAGVLVVSQALNSSGAGELIGNAVLGMLGTNPSSLKVITVFCLVTVIMTNFLNNNGTVAIMTPIAVSTALAGGMNPRAVVLVIYSASCLAIAFPTGCAASTMAYAIAKLNPVKMLKFTIPFLILGSISIIISASIFYPVYG